MGNLQARKEEVLRNAKCKRDCWLFHAHCALGWLVRNRKGNALNLYREWPGKNVSRRGERPIRLSNKMFRDEVTWKNSPCLVEIIK
jgi:hypothetical protein